MTFESEQERRRGEFWDGIGLLVIFAFLAVIGCF